MMDLRILLGKSTTWILRILKYWHVVSLLCHVACAIEFMHPSNLMYILSLDSTGSEYIFSNKMLPEIYTKTGYENKFEFLKIMLMW